MGTKDMNELLLQVATLRARGLPPKAIAKALGIRSSEAAALVRASAQETAATAPEPAVVGCWVSCGWSVGLSWKGHDEWPADPAEAGTAPGLAQVLVAREHRRNRVSVCGFLVDPCCLGVKDTIGPRQMSDLDLAEFVPRYFRAFEDGQRRVTLDLAQHLVLGAVDYARSLGFEPHPDFAACRGHLGNWNGPSDIRFGYEGKPYFVAGPRDNVAKIMRTLQEKVGDGHFDFIAPVG